MHLLAHSSPLPRCGQQNTTKASAVHTRTWTDHSTIMLTGKTDSTCGKNTSSSFPTNQITLAEGEREPDLKNTPSLTPPFFPPSPLLTILHLVRTVAQGNGEWGLHALHPTLPLTLLSPQGEGSSHSSPAPPWHPSHGDQPSTTFSNTTPCHALQASTTCSSMAFPTHSRTPSGPHTGSTLTSSAACSGLSDPPLTSMACRDTACPLTMACRRIFALPHLLPLLLHSPRALHASFSHIPLLSALHLPFLLFSPLLPLLKYPIPEQLPPLVIASPLHTAGSELEPRKLLAASHRTHPSRPSPLHKPLPHKPNTTPTTSQAAAQNTGLPLPLHLLRHMSQHNHLHNPPACSCPKSCRAARCVPSTCTGHLSSPSHSAT